MRILRYLSLISMLILSSISLFAARSADFSLSSITHERTADIVYGGDVVRRFKITVYNAGPDSGAYNIRIHLSKDGEYHDNEDDFELHILGGDIPAGGRLTHEWDQLVPVNIQGDYFVVGKVFAVDDTTDPVLTNNNSEYAYGSASFRIQSKQAFEAGLVSKISSGESAAGYSDMPSMSLDGRYVVFESTAKDFVLANGSKTSDYTDIILSDRKTGAFRRVSVSSTGVQANNHSYSPSISADGMMVVFHSLATNLVDGVSNGFQHIYLHDVRTGQTLCVSRPDKDLQNTTATLLANANSAYPSISVSEAGRFVVYQSKATNLTSYGPGLVPFKPENTTYPYRPSNIEDIYLYDIDRDRTVRVNLRYDPASAIPEQAKSIYVVGGVNGAPNYTLSSDSFNPKISRDGRSIVFRSEANNLDVKRPDTNGLSDVFVVTNLDPSLWTGEVPPSSPAWMGAEPILWSTRLNVVIDSDTGLVTAQSVRDQNVPGKFIDSGAAYAPDISGDGRYVVFSSNATNLAKRPGYKTFTYNGTQGVTIAEFLNTLPLDSTNPLRRPQVITIRCAGSVTSFELDGNDQAYNEGNILVPIANSNSASDTDEQRAWRTLSSLISAINGSSLPVSAQLAIDSSGQPLTSGANRVFILRSTVPGGTPVVSTNNIVDYGVSSAYEFYSGTSTYAEDSQIVVTDNVATPLKTTTITLKGVTGGTADSSTVYITNGESMSATKEKIVLKIIDLAARDGLDVVAAATVNGVSSFQVIGTNPRGFGYNIANVPDVTLNSPNLVNDIHDARTTISSYYPTISLAQLTLILPDDQFYSTQSYNGSDYVDNQASNVYLVDRWFAETLRSDGNPQYDWEGAITNGSDILAGMKMVLISRSPIGHYASISHSLFDPNVVLDTTPDSLNASISDDGRYVAYNTLAVNLLPPFVRRNTDNSIRVLQPNVTDSGDVSIAQYTDLNGSDDVYIHDRDSAETGVKQKYDTANFGTSYYGNTINTRVSVNRFGFQTGAVIGLSDVPASRRAQISPDGRYVVYVSDAGNVGGIAFGDTNRQPLDHNSKRDVFFFDRRPIREEPTESLVPSAIIIAPVAGSTYPTGSAVSITASVTDPRINVAAIANSDVSFYVNGEFKGTAATGNGKDFTYEGWAPPSVGSYNVYVEVAYLEGTSTKIITSPISQVYAREAIGSLPVITDNKVSIGGSYVTDGTSGSKELPFGASVTLSLRVSDPDGEVTTVQYFANGQPLVTLSADSGNPTWEYSWAPTGAVGTIYVIHAKATDNDSNMVSTTSEAKLLIVPYNKPTPTIRVTPSTNVILGQTLNVIVSNIATSDGKAISLEISVKEKGATQSTTIATFSNPGSTESATWLPSVSTTYVFTAVVKDDLGGTGSVSSDDIVVSPKIPADVATAIKEAYLALYDRNPSEDELLGMYARLGPNASTSTQADAIAALVETTEFDNLGTHAIIAYLSVMGEYPSYDEYIDGLNKMQSIGFKPYIVELFQTQKYIMRFGTLLPQTVGDMSSQTWEQHVRAFALRTHDNTYGKAYQRESEKVTATNWFLAKLPYGNSLDMPGYDDHAEAIRAWLSEIDTKSEIFERVRVAGVILASGKGQPTRGEVNSYVGIPYEAVAQYYLDFAAGITTPPEKPVIIPQYASDENVTIGGVLSLTVNWTGSPKPSFKWFKNGKAVAGQTTDTFYIGSTVSADAAKYYVTATNIAGTTKSSVVAVSVVPLPATTLSTSQATLTLGSGALTGMSVAIPNTASSSGVKYSATGLPKGLKINSKTGEITGTITAPPGTYTATIYTQVGKYKTGTPQEFIVEAPLPPIALDSSLTTYQIGSGPVAGWSIFNPDSEASGLKYGASGLPKGLKLNSKTGVITGTITAKLTSNPQSFPVSFWTEAPGKNRTYLDQTITVYGPATPGSLNALTQQVTLGQGPVSGLSIAVASGAPSAGIKYYAKGLPAGLKLNPKTGEITGTIKGKPKQYTIIYGVQIGSNKTEVTLVVNVSAFPVAGSYTVNLDDGAAGQLTLTISDNGAYTGKLTYNATNKTYSLRGNFSLNGDESLASLTTPVSGNSALTLAVQIPSATKIASVTLTDGSILVATGQNGIGGSSRVPVTYTASQSVAGVALANASKHDVTIEEVDVQSFHFSDGAGGYATVSINSKNVLTFKGTGADGSKITASTTGSGDVGGVRTYLIYANPYKVSGGYFAGELNLTNGRFDAPYSDILWSKPEKPSDKLYPEGFGPLDVTIQE